MAAWLKDTFVGVPINMVRWEIAHRTLFTTNLETALLFFTDDRIPAASLPISFQMDLCGLSLDARRLWKWRGHGCVGSSDHMLHKNLCESPKSQQDIIQLICLQMGPVSHGSNGMGGNISVVCFLSALRFCLYWTIMSDFYQWCISNLSRCLMRHQFGLNGITLF